jgi:YD repeat-containing protein
LTNVNYSDATPDVSYTYNRAGQQQTITDILGTRTNVYDTYGQLTAEKLPDGTTLDRT